MASSRLYVLQFLIIMCIYHILTLFDKYNWQSREEIQNRINCKMKCISLIGLALWDQQLSNRPLNCKSRKSSVIVYSVTMSNCDLVKMVKYSSNEMTECTLTFVQIGTERFLSPAALWETLETVVCLRLAICCVRYHCSEVPCLHSLWFPSSWPRALTHTHSSSRSVSWQDDVTVHVLITPSFDGCNLLECK